MRLGNARVRAIRWDEADTYEPLLQGFSRLEIKVGIKSNRGQITNMPIGIDAFSSTVTTGYRECRAYSRI